MRAHDWTAPWQPAAAGKPALARDWAQAITAFGPAGTARAEVELHLRRHLEALHDALLAEPPDGAAAERVGAALVRLDLRDPDALAATVAVLGDRLLPELGLDGVTFAGPLHRLLGALAAGYARALAAH
ncbi:MAG TPA: hypothetical protein VLM05_11945 [Mycobacteriales bacterium]|nr:hypothetical protein [Mycobacteriales bacterium]